MLLTKILQSIDRIFDNSKRLGCELKCVKQLCNCESNIPVTCNVCCKLY